MFVRDVRPIGTALAAVVCAAVIGFALAPSLSAQSQRTPGPPPDTLVDVLITFQSTPTQADEGLVRGLGGSVKYRYQLVPGIAASLPQQAVAALQANPRVVVVEPDGLVFAIGHLDHATELANAWGIGHIGAGQVHGTVTSSNVTVAVIDSGIDYSHPDLNANYAGGHNFVNGGAPLDDNGHGTHVAGTIGAVRDGHGVVGVAPDVRLMALKVLNASGSGSWSSIIAAVEYAAANGAHITNNSYGAGSNPGSLVQAAFDNSAAAGVLHIAAAGNSGNCGGNNNSIGWPARFDSVVAVGAVNGNNQRPCFSSTGPALELAAPGVSINSTIPGGYAAYSGTSMASPHVAGTAALVISTGVGDAGEVRAILQNTAQSLGNPAHFGHGLVDAFAAVKAAESGGGTSGPEPEPDPESEPDQDPPAEGGVATVNAITYSFHGGPQSNRHLSVTVAIQNGDGAPVAGAGVSILLTNGSATASGSATTGSNGTVTFTWNNAPSGCYTTEVTALVAGGLTWDGYTPTNGDCK